MRPIDADYLENMGYELHRTYQQDANTMVYEVKKIADVPTIEAEPNTCEYWDSESHFCALRRPQAEPIRRGWWEDAGKTGYWLKCSKCGTYLYKGQKSVTKYCYNCGARMENERSE